MTSPRPAPGPAEPASRVAELRLRGPAGPLRARGYWPPQGRSTPALLVFFPAGGVEGSDALCRELCAAGIVVLAVASRSGPDQPAAIRDATAAVEWAAAHARELGADPDRFAVAGEGAGAGLAVAVAAHAREQGWPPLQLLATIVGARPEGPS